MILHTVTVVSALKIGVNACKLFTIWNCTVDCIPLKVKEGNDPDMAQSERNSHPKNRVQKKNKSTIRYLNWGDIIVS